MNLERQLTDAHLATWLHKAMACPEWDDLWAAWQLDQVHAAITGSWQNDKVAEFARDTRAMKAFLAWCGQYVKRKEGLIDGRTKRKGAPGRTAGKPVPANGQ
jgi:hypothetical protein